MAFPPSKRKMRKKEVASVSLSSMMDMMTIMLLFLLKSFSTTGALIKPYNGIDLPSSSVQTEPKKVLAVIISVEEGLLHDIEGDVKPKIVPVEEFLDDKEAVLPSLESFILKKQQEDQNLGKLKITDELTIQADKNVPYSWILKVTKTGEVTNITKYGFVIVKDEG